MSGVIFTQVGFGLRLGWKRLTVTNALAYHGALLIEAVKFLIHPIEIGLEQAPFVVFVYFFPHLNMQKTADYGPQQH